jgi:OTT_1508-like deaminase
MRGRLPDISRGRFYATSSKVINEYHSWTKSFLRHCEFTLIEYLLGDNLAPVEVGISKLCCAACHAWIEGINHKNYNQKWFVSGAHGKVFLCAKLDNPEPKVVDGEMALKEWL